MKSTMNYKLRFCMMLLLVMANVLVGVCQAPKAGFSAHATSLNFYFNDDPSVYAYTEQARSVIATVQISIVADGTFIPGMHTHPSWTWTVSITGPDPNNPQQTTTVGSATFTHPGPYTNGNVNVTLPAVAGAYTYTASLTDGEGTATPSSDIATIVKVNSLIPSEGTEFDDGDNDPNARSFVVIVVDEGDVIVTASPSPSIPTELMPLEIWSFTGGDLVTNDNKYQRSTSKSTIGTTIFVARCGDSEKITKIFCQENDTEVNIEISGAMTFLVGIPWVALVSGDTRNVFFLLADYRTGLRARQG